YVDDSRTAFLQESKGGRTLRLKEGQAVEGWQVVRIEPRKLVLSQGGREQELLLREIVAVKPPVQPAKQMAANTPQPAAPARGK
ncbi:MAG: hypothetical protein K2Q10_02195, partial [Rhodospirillales bacterium]|nr:hypothetical protein [Rhodospirillales bacterium]